MMLTRQMRQWIFTCAARISRSRSLAEAAAVGAWVIALAPGSSACGSDELASALSDRPASPGSSLSLVAGCASNEQNIDVK